MGVTSWFFNVVYFDLISLVFPVFSQDGLLGVGVWGVLGVLHRSCSYVVPRFFVGLLVEGRTTRLPSRMLAFRPTSNST